MILRKKKTWAATAAIGLLVTWKASVGATDDLETVNCNVMHVYSGHPGIPQLSYGEMKLECSGNSPSIRTYTLNPGIKTQRDIMEKVRAGQNIDVSVTGSGQITRYKQTAKENRENPWHGRYGKKRTAETFETVVNGRLDTQTTIATRLPAQETAQEMAQPAPRNFSQTFAMIP